MQWPCIHAQTAFLQIALSSLIRYRWIPKHFAVGGVLTLRRSGSECRACTYMSLLRLSTPSTAWLDR